MSASTGPAWDQRPNGTDGGAASVGVRRLSVVRFLMALVIMLVLLPFTEQFPNGELIESVLLTLVLLSAVAAVGGRRRTFIAAAILVTPAVVCKWFDHFWPDLIPRNLTIVTAILFAAFVIFHLMWFIMRAPRVDEEVLCAGIATYLMLGLLWTFAYILVAHVSPSAFVVAGPGDSHPPLVGARAMFLSFGTHTNAAVGEVTPATNGGRLLVLAEAATGMFFVTILIARLVGLYTSRNAAGPQS
jgi:hypothetical protein